MPPNATDGEVRDLIRNSIRPLLLAHRETKRRFVLAVTGHLLSRMAGLRCAGREIIELIKSLISEGVLELALTTYYEVFTPLVPPSHVEKHLEKDLKIKREHFSADIRTFYPGNFTWTPILGAFLPRFNIRYVILDEAGYRAASVIQSWKWKARSLSKLSTVLVDTYFKTKEALRPYRLNLDYSEGGSSRSVVVFFRDFNFVRKVSFGTSGLLHRIYEYGELLSYVRRRISELDPGEYIVLADDGDRVNAVSIHNYVRLLKDVPPEYFNTPSHAGVDEGGLHELAFIPAHSIADIHSFWLGDLDSVSYVYALNFMYSMALALSASGSLPKDVLEGVEEEFLELEDVYYIFWKNIQRKKYYVAKLTELYRKLLRLGNTSFSEE